MMSDIENDYVRCIIVRDLSRFGRNYIDAGYYIEKYFPLHGIRFIAITDNYDTANNNYDMMLPLRNILNEAYSIDISRKTKSTVNIYINQGIYLGGRPPFGYKKAPDNKHKMIIDEFAAEIVRQIFNWALEGKNISSIVRLLNANKIKSSGSYKYEQGIIKHKNLISNAKWSVRTVSWILANETYKGNLIQGKTKSDNIYGIHKRQYLEPTEWIKTENAHQEIISYEVFEAVRKILTKATADIPRKSIEPYTPNLFRGKIFCAHCGGRLDRKKSRQKYTYHCTANYVLPDSCGGNKISENEVIDSVINLLIQYSNSLKIPENKEDTKVIESEKNWLEMNISNIDDFRRSLYENFVAHVINIDEYRELKDEYEKKYEQQRKRYLKIMNKIAERKINNEKMRESAGMLDTLSKTMKLTKKVTDRFIRRIEVFRDGRIHIGFISINY